MNLEALFVDTIGRFRAELARLPPENHDLVQQLMDLRPPCQITGFSFDFPWQPWQAFILTHSRTAPDLQVRIYDGLKPWKAVEVMETELEDKLWDDEWQPDSMHRMRNEPEPTLRSVGVLACATIYEQMRIWALVEPKKHSGTSMARQMLSSRAALWTHIGDPARIDWNRIFEDTLRGVQAPDQPRPREMPAPPPSTYVEPAYPGRGAYHRPIFKVGKPKGAKPLQMSLWTASVTPGFLVFRDRLGPYEALVTHNGFVGLLTEDEKEVIRWLNLAMAGFRSLGYISRPIHESQLARFGKPDDEFWMSWGGMYPETPQADEVRWANHWLTEAEFKDGLRKAQLLAAEPYADRLPLLLEAEAHLLDEEFPQSLIFSWAIIEDLIAQRWETFLETKGVFGKRRDSLTNSREWPVQSRLDALQLAGELPGEVLERLVQTKKVRNRAMHGAGFPSREEALGALDVAEELLIGGSARIRVKPKNPYDEGDFL